MAVRMSYTSLFSFTLIRKTLPSYYPCSSNFAINPFLFSHSQFLPFNEYPASLSLSLLSGDSPEFPEIRPVPPPSFPLEIPQFSPPPEIDPSTPSELPSITPEPEFPPRPPGPEFPKPPLPSPPGIDVPLPPRKPPEIEPPWPGSPVPEPEILPPSPPEEVPPRPPSPPRPFGPEILTSASPPGFVALTYI
ncbi:hypothetical protein Csa_011403 [Cucumis sativus]|uniref:Uncharacterized protein n=1 Tax=Cucumis sativus TaxID=3659 RepID=A0A0A0L4M0_CUCSA|nr:hypothetical protein Csa_011403 [Cucumis sativus]